MQSPSNAAQSLSQGLDLFLDQLASATDPIAPDKLGQILASAEISLEDFSEWIRFDNLIYSRNQVAVFPQVELLVMCWQSGQATPIHDHKGSACAVRVLKGVTTEIIYKSSASGKLVPASSARYPTESVFHSYDQDIHQMGNFEANDADLITLHCYSPPLSRMKLFNQSTAYFDGYETLVTRAESRMRL